jgi:monofunctional chorismate mutase
LDRLEELRRNIDSIDRDLTNLLERRFELVSQIAEYKLQNKLPILNNNREMEVIKRISMNIKNTEIKEYIEELFQFIMDNSRKFQANLIDKMNPK